jgi:hypothetical protein
LPDRERPPWADAVAPVCVIGKIGYNQSNRERALKTNARFVVKRPWRKSGQLDVPPEERSERFLPGIVPGMRRSATDE